MSIDISQFHETFFEESFEGLDIMESTLLELDLGEVDNENINTIFRAAHSIKGGSATFGFNDIASFTHVIETLLDEMRDLKRDVTQESVDLLLTSVDCMREMMNATRDSEEIDRTKIDETHNKLETMLGSEPIIAKNDNTGTPEQVRNIRDWSIDFKPDANMMKTGNDPMRIIKEIHTLGETIVTIDTSQVPDIHEISPEDCYLSWNIHLKSSCSEADIKEIFDWVEDECTLTIKDTTPVETDTELTTQIGNSTTGKAPVGSKKNKKSRQEGGSIRVNIDKVDDLINMVGELVITQSMMGQLDEDIETFDAARIEKLREGLALLERNTRELQESVMRIRMMPISSIFNRFPRMVHDLSAQLGKEIELKITGETTELDKTVMEKIGDPLVHLIRNSVDHGIETSELRAKTDKPKVGTINLDAYHKGGNIIIDIIDDGAGFNKERIKEKAIEKGLINPQDELSEEKIYDLIFQPGFSTAEVVSDVSGRGVGMDVVKRNIRELGGNIEITSTQGSGTTFSIRLPLTLAILDGQLVSVGSETYIIPLVSIIESLQINPEQANVISGKHEVYKLRNEYIPIIRLHEVFDIPNAMTDLSTALLVVIEGAGQKVGLMVDDLLGQQQVVIKSLETNFKRIEGLSGATILGDGKVALITDVDGLVSISRTLTKSDLMLLERSKQAAA